MLSGFLFSLEFLFTRIFSFLVWYHFAFIIISTAILGLGLGGLWVQKRLADNQEKSNSISLIRLQWVLLLAYGAIILLLYINLFNFFPMLYMLLSILPFAVGGAIMSTIYVRMSHYAHTLYFTDLIGAITFGLLTFLILDKNGMIVTLLFLLITLLIIQMLFSYVCKNIKIFLLSALLIAAAISASTLNLTSFERRFGELLALLKHLLLSQAIFIIFRK